MATFNAASVLAQLSAAFGAEGMEFKKEFNNGTGYFDCLQKKTLPRGKVFSLVADDGRHIVAVGGGDVFETAVIFQRAFAGSKLVICAGGRSADGFVGLSDVMGYQDKCTPVECTEANASWVVRSLMGAIVRARIDVALLKRTFEFIDGAAREGRVVDDETSAPQGVMGAGLALMHAPGDTKVVHLQKKENGVIAIYENYFGWDDKMAHRGQLLQERDGESPFWANDQRPDGGTAGHLSRIRWFA